MKLLLLVFTTFLFTSCDHKVTNTDNNVNHTPLFELQIGQERQLVFLEDSTTWSMKIIGDTTREDGQTVFIEEEYYGTGTIDTSYLYFSGDYLVYTKLFKDESRPQNPYHENLIASRYPTEEGSWFAEIDEQNDTSDYIRSRRLNICTIPAKAFDSSWSFDFYGSPGASTPFLNVVYTQDIGYISSFQNGKQIVALSYFKSNSVEIGERWPDRGFSILSQRSNTNYKLNGLKY